MKIIKIQRHFKAWHAVDLATGPEKPHSHQWRVIVSFKSDDAAIVIANIDQLVNELDEVNLNQLDELKPFAASAESVAMMIYRRLSEKLGQNSQILKVDIEEEHGCWATYFEEDK